MKRNKKKLRIIIDAGMSIAVLLLMSINLVGQQLHEYLGMATGVLFLMHLYLNRKWAKNLAKGSYNSRRFTQTSLNIALLITMFLQMISGMMISRYLPFHGPVESMRIMTRLHTSAGYIGFVLMCLHAALHLHPFRKNERIRAAAKTTLMLLTLAIALLAVVFWKQDNAKRREAEYVMPETAQIGQRPDSAIAETSAAQTQLETEDAVPEEVVPEEAVPTRSVSSFQISLDFNRASTPASNQIAVWVEDEAGNLIRTISVTSFTGIRRGYEWRPMSLNHWLEKAAPQNLNDTELDAISEATPATGTYSFTWDLLDQAGNKVPDGNYVIKVEGTLYWESNILYQMRVNTADPDNIPEVTVERSEPENSQNEDMLSSVSIVPVS